MYKSVYCDSSGLSAILLGNRLCKDAGGKFIIASLKPNVQKLIEISQLNSVLKRLSYQFLAQQKQIKKLEKNFQQMQK